MPGSEDFEKLVRHCKKVANLDAERERADRRFRAIDTLKDFIRKNYHCMSRFISMSGTKLLLFLCC